MAVVAFSVVALSLTASRWRAVAAAGSVVFALGTASLRTASYPGPGSEFVPNTFFAVALGMIALGGTAGLVAAIGGTRSTRAAPIAISFAVIGLGLSGPTFLALSRAAGLGPAFKASVALVGIAVALYLILKWLRPGRVMIWLDRRLLEPSEQPEPITRSVVVWELAGAALALAAPWFVLSCIGVLIALVARGLAIGRSATGWSRAVLLLILAGLPLVLLAQVTLQVAGTPLVRFGALQDAPFSAAFETLAALLLLLVTWTTAGLWPFHGLEAGGPLALGGWALLLRFGVDFVPNGLEHWRPILFLLGAIAICHSAAARRPDRALVALGLLGAACLAPPVWPSVVMLLAGVVAWPRWPAGSALRWVSSQRWLVLLPAAALTPLLAACLGVETASTTLATLGLLSLAVSVASPSLSTHIPDALSPPAG